MAIPWTCSYQDNYGIYSITMCLCSTLVKSCICCGKRQ